MVRCAPGHDAITGRPIKATMDKDALILVAKGVGMTMHGYINANKSIVFEVYYPSYDIWIVYNDLPGPYISYNFLPSN